MSRKQALEYQRLYRQSMENPLDFWENQAKQCVSWFKQWKQTITGNFSEGNVRWFTQGKLNASFNCLDRHLPTKKDHIAIIWEGNSPDTSRTITFGELHQQVCKFANVLKKHGIKKGDRVCIYLPMIPEIVISMLACARIGAIHSVVFAGFSSDSLKTRILDAQCALLITADEGKRGDKSIPLKSLADQALNACPQVNKCIVVKHTGCNIGWNEEKDSWFSEEIDSVDAHCPAEEMDANDPLFILYTSGSTGKPKGILHSTGGYLVYCSITHKYIFDYQQNDIYWCSADLGWITGHSYLLYGPLTNGATTLLFEGIPSYPDFSRFWQIIDKHQVTIFYTSPTAIRSLRKEGEQWVKRTSRKSLRILGTVGEPINPDVWQWYKEIVGNNACAIVDTWWQTETGGILLSAIPGATPQVPGSVTGPFLGIQAAIVDEKNQVIEGNKHGRLVIKKPWPGLMLTIYGDHQRYLESYFKEVPGYYLSGDSAYCDSDGHFWILGRNDDVIKVSGHRIGSEEVESALLQHPAVAEAAVVGVPHDITGEAIYAFVTLKTALTPSDHLKDELNRKVREAIGAIVKLETIQWTVSLPKTRSGKIMRRVLRKIASHQVRDLGDISTLAEPSVINEIIEGAKRLTLN